MYSTVEKQIFIVEIAKLLYYFSLVMVLGVPNRIIKI